MAIEIQFPDRNDPRQSLYKIPIGVGLIIGAPVNIAYGYYRWFLKSQYESGDLAIELNKKEDLL